VAEELEIKVKAETGEAVANLGKTEKAVEGVKKETVELDKSAGTAAKSVDAAGKSSKEAAQEVAKLGESTSSTRGMFKGLAEMGGEVGQKLGVLAGKAIAVASAFTMGFQSGLKMREGLVALGVTVPDLSDKMAALVLRTEELVRGYEKAELVESAAMNRAKQIIALREAQAASERALGAAMAASGVEWKSASAEREKVVAQLNAYEQILARTGKSEGEYNAAIKENADALKAVADAAEKYGINLGAVAPRTAAAAAAAAELATAQKAVTESTKETTASLQGEIDALGAAIEASTRLKMQDQEAGAARRDHTTAVEASERAQTQLNDATHAGVTEMNGWVGVAGPATRIYLTIAQASDEATAALLRQAEATRALTAAQSESLEAVKGWTDYVIALKQGYEDGTTSLYNYITELTRFKTQLQQIFGGVTGEAKKELEAMIALIQKMISTAGAGGAAPRAGGYAGTFQRDADKRDE